MGWIHQLDVPFFLGIARLQFKTTGFLDGIVEVSVVDIVIVDAIADIAVESCKPGIEMLTANVLQ